MMDEIEELWEIVHECRERVLEESSRLPTNASPADRRVMEDFERLGKKLDDIAKRLAARMPT